MASLPPGEGTKLSLIRSASLEQSCLLNRNISEMVARYTPPGSSGTVRLNSVCKKPRGGGGINALGLDFSIWMEWICQIILSAHLRIWFGKVLFFSITKGASAMALVKAINGSRSISTI